MFIELKALRALPAQRLQPIFWGLLLVAAVWAGVSLKLSADLRDDLHDADRTAQNFAMVFEENVLRSIGEIDKSLLYLRHRIASSSQSEDLNTIANTTDVLSEIIVQVAIIDADGIMRATNAGPMPERPIDLSDRPHFRAHLGRSEDLLCISVPMIGRASGKMSVQMSRRFSKSNGQFGGVVVASLDPSHLTKFYDKIDLGMQASIALIGEDGVVRSSGGAGGGLKPGTELTETDFFIRMKKNASAIFDLDDGNRGLRRVTTRKVRGQPLYVSVDVARADIDADAWLSLRANLMLAVALTALVALGVARLLRIEIKRREAESHVRRLAAEDPLTGLPNRRVFRAALEEAVTAAEKADGVQFSLLFLDVDHFKLHNDTLGHKAGDALLQEISRRTSALLEKGQILARIGGDEFAVLLPGYCDRISIEVLTQRMISALKNPFLLNGQRVRASMSVGIAIGLQDGRSADDLLVAADLALYAVKTAERGTYRFYEVEMGESVSERGRLENDLRLALEKGELDLHYQPAVSSRTGHIAGFEALSRWQHPERGNIPPATFIPIAEETDLIHVLGEWSLREACSQAMTWPEDLKVAVNLSPAQFVRTDLAGIVSRILAETGLPASRLELELTEQMLLKNSEQTLSILGELKALGVRISMDDFGTGYSSLNYLRRFPFDRIKIDRSFVTELADGPQHVALVRAVVDIARSLGMTTTAEGVETQAQLLHLVALRCDEVQGYLFSRPVPAEDVPSLIAKWPAGWQATEAR